MTIEGVDTTVAGFVGRATMGPLDDPIRVSSSQEFESIFGGGDPQVEDLHLADAAAAFFANGGQHLYVVRVAAFDDATLVGQDGGSAATRTGLQTLLDVDEVSVVAIPGAASTAVHLALIDHCRQGGDRMALLDPARDDDADAVLSRRAALPLDADPAALYFPWVEIDDAGTPRLLPPSGFVAGVYSRTSPHESPVGALSGASGVAVAVDDADQSRLNPAGVNAIREFSGLGVQVWGARTLSEDPDHLYVAVRRQALFLEESIAEGTRWALFETNDATLWNELEIAIENFLFGLFQDGWFNGTTAGEAYFVRVDTSTMTQQDVEEGRTVMLVGFAPLRPAEFVILRIVQDRGILTSTPPAAEAARLRPAYPNPFNPLTRLVVELPRDQWIRLEIFDVAGRRVRRLREGVLPAGTHELSWNGRDGRGSRVASGRYTARLTTPEAASSVGLVLLQ